MVFIIHRDNKREKQLREKYGIIDKYVDGKIKEYLILESTVTFKIYDWSIWELTYNCLCPECGRLTEFKNSFDNSELLTKYFRKCNHCNVYIVIGIKHTSINELRRFKDIVYKINKERKENNAGNRLCPFCAQFFGRIDPSLSYNYNIDNKVELTKCRICGTEVILDKSTHSIVLIKFLHDDGVYKYNDPFMSEAIEIKQFKGLDIETAYNIFKELILGGGIK